MEQNHDTELWKQYEAGLEYQRSKGFTEKWPEFERFKNNDQWPAATKATAALPRPVLNITEYLIRNKKANVLSQNTRMIFVPNDMPYAKNDDYTMAASDFTGLAQQTWYNVRQDDLRVQMVEDAATLGTGILHYYWDNNIKGGSVQRFVGGISGEVLDPSSVFVGNPEEKSVQRQPHVIVATREDLGLFKERLKRMTDADGKRLVGDSLIAEITSDGDNSDLDIYDAERSGSRDKNKVTVLTQYKRIDGIVHISRSVRNVDVLPPTPMNGMTRYPLVSLSWKENKRCFYGIGEIEGLIPIQKSLNLIYALMIMSVQQMGWPKLVLYNGAVDKKITGKIGEVLYNNLQDPNAIRYLDPPQFNNAAFQVADQLVNYVRTFSGVTEVLTGDRIASDMAAGAIMAIQNANRQPLLEFQAKLNRAMREVGEIWEEFFKHYYTMPVPVMVDNGTGKRERRVFTGSDYADITFDLNVEVGEGSAYGEPLAQSQLDRLYYEKGEITLEEYAQLASKNAMPFADRMLMMINSRVDKVDIYSQLLGAGVIMPEAIPLLGQAGLLDEEEATAIIEQSGVLAGQGAEQAPPQPQAM